MGENKNNNEGGENNKGDGENKKSPVAATAVLKLSLSCPCLGCIDKIHKIVKKTKGVQEHSVDKQKDLVAVVTVKGIMDVKALAESLKEKMKRQVEVVPPKKEKDGNNVGGGDNNGRREQKAGEDGGGQEGESGDDDSNSGGGGGGGGGGKEKKAGGDGGGAGKVEENKIEYVVQPGNGYEFGYQTIAYMRRLPPYSLISHKAMAIRSHKALTIQ